MNKYTAEEIEYARIKIKSICYQHPDVFSHILRAKSNTKLLGILLENTSCLDNYNVNLATRCYWFINNIIDWSDSRVQCQHCHKPLYGKNAKVFRGYIRPHCNISCSQADKKVCDKRHSTKFRKFGSLNNGKKIHKTYAEQRYHELTNDKDFEILFSKDEFINNYKLNTDHRFNLKCKKCGHVEQTNLCSKWKDKIGQYHICRCHKCYPTIYNYSKGELEVLEYVISICKQFNYIVKHNDKSLYKNNCKAIDFDIHVVDINLLIEYDGCYYHSEEFISKEQIKNKNKHRVFLRTYQKTEIAECLGLRLIHIFEDQWIGDKEFCKNIIKNAIINNYINYNDNIIILDRSIYNKTEIPLNYKIINIIEPRIKIRIVNDKVHHVYDCGYFICKKRE